MNELTIKKDIKLPVIDVNFQEIKINLNTQLEEYKTLVVTEDTLPACRDARKELNALSKELETSRKDIKNQLTSPIKEFEDKCKELLSLVEDVKKPIGEAINEFTERKRLEKKTKVEKLFSELMEASRLKEKYVSRIELRDSYFKINTSMKSIKESIENQITIQSSNQDRESNNKAFVKNQLNILNSQLSAPIKIDELFITDYENMDISVIGSRINNIYKSRKEAEEKARIDAERKIKEEAERKAREEYEKKFAEEKKIIEEAKKADEGPEIINKEENEELTENLFDPPAEREIGFVPLPNKDIEVGFEPVVKKYIYSVLVKAVEGQEDKILDVLSDAGFESKVVDIDKED